MKKSWQIMSLAFVGASVFVLILSFQYPYNDKLGPGPAFFPVWMSIITGGLALALFIQTSRRKGPTEGVASLLPDRAGIWRILLILIALVGVLFFLDFLGFRISLFLFLLFLTPALGFRNWWMTTIFALAGSIGIFHIFYYWLQVPLPIGIFNI
ncbi:MAG: tripartite tricarboxylate transporter TctB family protein [Deltaproteobacteria bacterium]|nr:tripartite tricarboxylate transporter TctB family protein [Deltaproteobacteria bacterium]